MKEQVKVYQSTEKPPESTPAAELGKPESPWRSPASSASALLPAGWVRNGVRSHYHYDLVTTVLRKEWGYEGPVITDRWMQRSKSPEFPSLENNAYRVRAQVDVLMPGDMRFMVEEYKTDPSLRKTLGKPDGITKAELQWSAANTLRMILKLHKTV